MSRKRRIFGDRTTCSVVYELSFVWFLQAVVDPFAEGFPVIASCHLFWITKNAGRSRFVRFQLFVYIGVSSFSHEETFRLFCRVIFWFCCSNMFCYAANFTLLVVQQKVLICCYFCLFKSYGVHVAFKVHVLVS